MITLASITSYLAKRKNTSKDIPTTTSQYITELPVAGPIVGRKFDLNDTYDDDVDSDKIENHVPVAGVYPLHTKRFYGVIS